MGGGGTGVRTGMEGGGGDGLDLRRGSAAVATAGEPGRLRDEDFER